MELSDSIRELNFMIEEIAILEMRVLFKQATESVAKNFASSIKNKYGLELESTEQIRRLI